jgi:hypothetical protein
MSTLLPAPLGHHRPKQGALNQTRVTRQVEKSVCVFGDAR